MKKDIYRKAALERLATVDQLDKEMKITSPLSWLALLGVTLIIAAVLAWSFIGELPSTVTANGIIVSSTTATNTIIANAGGTVELLVKKDEGVRAGQGIAKITPTNQNEEPVICEAPQDCVISALLVEQGMPVAVGTELAQVRPIPKEGVTQVVVCYVPISEIRKIKTDENAIITLPAADSSTYGHMAGRVINIDTYATSTKGVEAVLGTENNMAAQFMKDGGVCAVTLDIGLNSAWEGESAKNKYWWSSQNGYSLEVRDKTTCVVKITTETEKPIYRLFSKLKDIWGGNK